MHLIRLASSVPLAVALSTAIGCSPPPLACGDVLREDPARRICTCPNGGEYRDGLCYLDGSVTPLDGMTLEPDGGSPCEDRTFYRDADGDGFGDRTRPTRACEPPEGYVEDDTDCDDACEGCHPGADEVCDAELKDENCDGRRNEGDAGCSCVPGSTPVACGPPAVGECRRGAQACVGGVFGECVGATGPSEETCNGLDDDCDGNVDEEAGALWFPDCDGDGFAAASALSSGLRGCARPAVNAPSCPAGTLARWTDRAPETGSADCRDDNQLVYPGQTTFFASVIAGTSGDWDYDCDGAATFEHPVRGSNNVENPCSPVAAHCPSPVVFGAPLQCGREAYLVECAVVPFGGCQPQNWDPSGALEVQRCR